MDAKMSKCRLDEKTLEDRLKAVYLPGLGWTSRDVCVAVMLDEKISRGIFADGHEGNFAPTGFRLEKTETRAGKMRSGEAVGVG